MRSSGTAVLGDTHHCLLPGSQLSLRTPQRPVSKPNALLSLHLLPNQLLFCPLCTSFAQTFGLKHQASPSSGPTVSLGYRESTVPSLTAPHCPSPPLAAGMIFRKHRREPEGQHGHPFQTSGEKLPRDLPPQVPAVLSGTCCLQEPTPCSLATLKRTSFPFMPNKILRIKLAYEGGV